MSEAGKDLKASLGKSRLVGLKLLAQLQKFLVKPCQALLQDAAVMQQLRSLDADAVMAFGIPSVAGDSCGCMMSDALGVPWVDVYGHPMITSPLSVPQMGSGNTPADLKTLKGFARNIPLFLVLRAMPLVLELLGSPWVKARREAGLPQLQSAFPPANAAAWLLGAKWGVCKPVVQVFLNSWLVEWPRPLQPHQVLVGPGTPRPARPIAQPDTAAFVDSAPAGVVLMATGTTPQAKLVLSPKDITELAEGFALLAPTRVVWAIKEKHLPEGVTLSELPLSENVRVVHWVDYNDVLGHRNVRALVSHCGWHSVNEAVYHGVPVVGVPFQFEQAENVDKLRNHGMAVLMPNDPSGRGGKNVTFNRQEVADAIRKVIDDPSYAAAARGMSHALQMYSKRRHPYARAADEIELAINAQHAQDKQRQPVEEPVAAGELEADGGSQQQAQDEL